MITRVRIMIFSIFIGFISIIFFLFKIVFFLFFLVFFVISCGKNFIFFFNNYRIKNNLNDRFFVTRSIFEKVNRSKSMNNILKRNDDSILESSTFLEQLFYNNISEGYTLKQYDLFLNYFNSFLLKELPAFKKQLLQSKSFIEKIELIRSFFVKNDFFKNYQDLMHCSFFIFFVDNFLKELDLFLQSCFKKYPQYFYGSFTEREWLNDNERILFNLKKKNLLSKEIEEFLLSIDKIFLTNSTLQKNSIFFDFLQVILTDFYYSFLKDSTFNWVDILCRFSFLKLYSKMRKYLISNFDDFENTVFKFFNHFVFASNLQNIEFRFFLKNSPSFNIIIESIIDVIKEKLILDKNEQFFSLSDLLNCSFLEKFMNNEAIILFFNWLGYKHETAEVQLQNFFDLKHLNKIDNISNLVWELLNFNSYSSFQKFIRIVKLPEDQSTSVLSDHLEHFQLSIVEGTILDYIWSISSYKEKLIKKYKTLFLSNSNFLKEKYFKMGEKLTDKVIYKHLLKLQCHFTAKKVFFKQGLVLKNLQDFFSLSSCVPKFFYLIISKKRKNFLLTDNVTIKTFKDFINCDNKKDFFYYFNYFNKKKINLFVNFKSIILKEIFVLYLFNFYFLLLYFQIDKKHYFSSRFQLHRFQLKRISSFKNYHDLVLIVFFDIMLFFLPEDNFIMNCVYKYKKQIFLNKIIKNGFLLFIKKYFDNCLITHFNDNFLNSFFNFDLQTKTKCKLLFEKQKKKEFEKRETLNNEINKSFFFKEKHLKNLSQEKLMKFSDVNNWLQLFLFKIITMSILSTKDSYDSSNFKYRELTTKIENKFLLLQTYFEQQNVYTNEILYFNFCIFNLLNYCHRFLFLEENTFLLSVLFSWWKYFNVYSIKLDNSSFNWSLILNFNNNNLLTIKEFEKKIEYFFSLLNFPKVCFNEKKIVKLIYTIFMYNFLLFFQVQDECFLIGNCLFYYFFPLCFKILDKYKWNYLNILEIVKEYKINTLYYFLMKELFPQQQKKEMFTFFQFYNVSTHYRITFLFFSFIYKTIKKTYL